MYPYGETDAAAAATDKQDALQRLVQDPLYWREQDPEFRSYVDNGFKSVYGNEEAERDATGRTLDPAPRPVALPPFRPSVQPDDVSLAGAVGENQPNRWRDVYKVQKGLANTGHFALDLTKEKSGEHTPTLAQAIRNFQREKREEIDGLLLPGGPTIKRLGETLFGESASGKQVLQGTAPRPEIGAPADANSDQLQLASHLPKQKPPRPPGPRPEPPWEKWLPEQIRKALDRPSSREKVQIPEGQERTPDRKRAVIVTMPNNDAYILLEPAPRDKRSPGKSDFVGGDGAQAAPHRASEYSYRNMPPTFRHALPMYAEEAEEVRQRVAEGEERNVYKRWMAEKPMYRSMDVRPPGEVDRRQPLIIRYYLEDGSVERHQATHSGTNRPLWVPGDRIVEISAHDAVRLGLTDWMPHKPPRTNFPEINERESWKHFFPVPRGEEGLSR